MTTKTTTDGDTVESLRADLDHAIAVMERVERRRSGGVVTSGVSTVNINAGGVAVWLCAMMCAVMLASGGVYAFLTSQENAKRDAKISTMSDYLQAIYAQAPQLKPKDESQ